jgi:hypothetical protein
MRNDMLKEQYPPILEQIVNEYSELIRIRNAYYELLFSVANKYPDESRHETALRYIRQAENQCNPPAENEEV